MSADAVAHQADRPGCAEAVGSPEGRAGRHAARQQSASSDGSVVLGAFERAVQGAERELQTADGDKAVMPSRPTCCEPADQQLPIQPAAPLRHPILEQAASSGNRIADGATVDVLRPGMISAWRDRRRGPSGRGTRSFSERNKQSTGQRPQLASAVTLGTVQGGQRRRVGASLGLWRWLARQSESPDPRGAWDRRRNRKPHCASSAGAFVFVMLVASAVIVAYSRRRTRRCAEGTRMRDLLRNPGLRSSRRRRSFRQSPTGRGHAGLTHRSDLVQAEFRAQRSQAQSTEA